MKIKTQFVRIFSCFFGIVLLLTPLTVLAQTKVVVIPLGDDAKPLKNVITVAKANGMFTDPVAAVDSITDASATNPYLVAIGPGVYTITQTLEMKQYVDIAGSGENVTKLKGGISGNFIQGAAIIRGASNSAMSFLTVENTGGHDCSLALYNDTASPRIHNVTAIASGGTSSNFGICNYGSSPTMTNVKSRARGTGEGLQITHGIYNANSSSPKMVNVTARAHGGGIASGVFNDGSSPTMTHVTAEASGGIGNNGVANENSSSPMMMDVTATAEGESGVGFCTGVSNINSSPTMRNVIARASGGERCYGVYTFFNYLTQTTRPIMTGVTAVASGGTQYTEGIFNHNVSPVMTDITAEASAVSSSCDECVGVKNDYSSATMRNVSAKASGGGAAMGVWNHESQPTMTNVTATASGGINATRGVSNTSTSAGLVFTMTDVVATALGRENCCGVYNSGPTPTMTNVTANGFIYGIYIQSSLPATTLIRRSAMKGLFGLYASPDSTVKVSQSTITNGVDGGGPLQCVACDNGNGGALDSNCLNP
jgi:hypothetical protein